jgi:hypothetical protein
VARPHKSHSAIRFLRANTFYFMDFIFFAFDNWLLCANVAEFGRGDYSMRLANIMAWIAENDGKIVLSVVSIATGLLLIFAMLASPKG